MSVRYSREQLENMGINRLRSAAKSVGLRMGNNVRHDATRVQWVDNILNRQAELDAQTGEISV